MAAPAVVSVVVPVYNEESNIGPCYEALAGVLERHQLAGEIIFVDDGSGDGSFAAIESLSRRDGRVKCVRLSRNFGSHAALMAGLRSSSGAAAIIMSADLQDPPDLIPELVRRWREGSEVVWAVREGRDDPLLKKTLAAAFYKLYRRIALPAYPPTGMDFGLFDRRIVDHLCALREVNHFLPAMVVWLGFRQAQVPYFRRARRSGRSKWSLGRRVKAALDAVIAFSAAPVRLITYVGLTVMLVSLVSGAMVIVRRLAFGFAGSGWLAVVVAVLFLSGVQLVMLGLLGEYLWRGVEQSKGRPQFIVRDRIGFDVDHQHE